MSVGSMRSLASVCSALSSNAEVDRDALYPDAQNDDLSYNEDSNHALVLSSWDAELLAEWNSTRDRTNRWILHTLGSDPTYAKLHRKLLRQAQGLPTAEHDQLSDRMWARLVLKYWFIDEAAESTQTSIKAAEDFSFNLADVWSFSSVPSPPLDPGPKVLEHVPQLGPDADEMPQEGRFRGKDGFPRRCTDCGQVGHIKTKRK